MKKKIKRILFFSIAVLLLIFSIEFLSRIAGLQPSLVFFSKNIISVVPDSFFVEHPTLGWRMGGGKFNHIRNDSILIFTHLNDENGNRISSYTNKYDTLPWIALYGCSYTFGSSVADSCTQAFYLQQMFPSYKVVNRGCPAYGLLQMYISLQEDVKNGNKPALAVFNYASFQDERTPQCRAWSERFKYAIELSKGDKSLDIKYPYPMWEDDNMKVLYMDLDDMPNNFPFRDKSILIDQINLYYSHYFYNKQLLNNNSYKIANLIIEYCNNKQIPLIFGGMTNDSKDFLWKLEQERSNTLLYGIDVSDPQYNCSPLDPLHPNKNAHLMYATILKDYIISNHLLN